MINYGNVTKENINKRNPNWTQTPDNPYIIFITGGYRSGKNKRTA